MLKWFLNKSLRFQIAFVIGLVLSVPAAVTIWNVVIPSKESNTLREMQEVTNSYKKVINVYESM